jgi:hypothetical protein
MLRRLEKAAEADRAEFTRIFGGGASSVHLLAELGAICDPFHVVVDGQPPFHQQIPSPVTGFWMVTSEKFLYFDFIFLLIYYFFYLFLVLMQYTRPIKLFGFY